METKKGMNQGVDYTEVPGIGYVMQSGNKVGLVDKMYNILVPCQMEAMEVEADLDYCIFSQGVKVGFFHPQLGYFPPIYDGLKIEFDKVLSVYALFEGKVGSLHKEEGFIPSKEVSVQECAIPLEKEIMDEYERHANHPKEGYVYVDGLDKYIFGKNGQYVIHLFGGHFN